MCKSPVYRTWLIIMPLSAYIFVQKSPFKGILPYLEVKEGFAPGLHLVCNLSSQPKKKSTKIDFYALPYHLQDIFLLLTVI